MAGGVKQLFQVTNDSGQFHKRLRGRPRVGRSTVPRPCWHPWKSWTWAVPSARLRWTSRSRSRRSATDMCSVFITYSCRPISEYSPPVNEHPEPCISEPFHPCLSILFVLGHACISRLSVRVSRWVRQRNMILAWFPTFPLVLVVGPPLGERAAPCGGRQIHSTSTTKTTRTMRGGTCRGDSRAALLCTHPR